MPEIGPRGLAVVDELLRGLDALALCEHLTGSDAERYWIALDPARVLCEFCWGAAQVLAPAAEITCGFCGWPVAGPGGQDAVLLARLTPGLAAHFWLCRICAGADRAGRKR